MNLAFVACVFSLTISRVAGGSTVIGSPCFAGENAMQIYSDASHGGLVDMTDKVAIVTGADGGIGKEIVRALAARNATVVMAGHNLQKVGLAADDIRSTVPHAKLLIPASIDLADMANTRAFAEATYKALNGGAVHVLVNDAAMPNNPHGYTTNDLDQNGKPFEMLFEVNYVNQWLLTHLFLPQMRAAKGSRVVNLVSKAYRMSCPLSMRRDCMNLDKMPPPVITTDPNKTVPILDVRPSNYGIAKLLMIRWTEDLAAREASAASGVVAYTVDPGFVNTSMAGQSSPFWNKLACEDEGRKGAPCPVPSNQGALTPTFLSLSPNISQLSGRYFEWCANFTVSECIDSIKDVFERKCALSSQADKDKLWALSSAWVHNFSGPIGVQPSNEPIGLWSTTHSQPSCPWILKPLCEAYNASKCFSQCSKQVSACTSDKTCRSSLEASGECMVISKLRNTSAQNALTCLIPDNKLRDDVFYCLLDEYNCIPTPQDGPIYPTCRDADIKGSATFAPASLDGKWWKVKGWSKGEPYECRPCSRVEFWNATLSPNVPIGRQGPAKTDPQTVIMSSTWLEKDIHGKQWLMNDTSYFGPREARLGFPAKMQHYGIMLGLSYDEKFTVVHDATADAEPFVFLYGCGVSKQGAYVTGLVLARTATVSATLDAKINAVAVANGFMAQDWCHVNNTCANL